MTLSGNFAQGIVPKFLGYFDTLRFKPIHAQISIGAVVC